MANKIEKNKNSNNTETDAATKKLDRLDCKLIRLLQTDGRMPNNAIAQKLGISEWSAITLLTEHRARGPQTRRDGEGDD